VSKSAKVFSKVNHSLNFHLNLT